MRHKRPEPSPAPDEREKKERVIHTRVPESLEAELRERAQSLGISVSNLVRNVLGHAFGLVGDVVADSHAIARAARGEVGASPAARAAAGASPASLDDVLGWQPLVLGKNAVCAKCNTVLLRGADAATGIAADGAARLVICLACLQEQRA